MMGDIFDLDNFPLFGLVQVSRRISDTKELLNSNDSDTAIELPVAMTQTTTQTRNSSEDLLLAICWGRDFSTLDSDHLKAIRPV